MLYFIIFASILAVCSCQAYFDDTTTQKPWKGPFANNKIGELVQDTPEVARAKAEHARFFQEALKVLPTLPPEERYISGPYEISPQNQGQQPFLLQLQEQPDYQAPQQQYQMPKQIYQQQFQQPAQYQQPAQQYHPLNLRFQDPEPEYQYEQNSRIPKYTGYEEPRKQDQQYQQTPKYPFMQYKELAELQGSSPYYQSVPKQDTWNGKYDHKQDEYEAEFPEKYFALPQREEQGYYVPEESAPVRYLAAEDVPRSPFGETPEVALARKAHLEAVAAAKEKRSWF